jgi:hypothetical protein
VLSVQHAKAVSYVKERDVLIMLKTTHENVSRK